MYFLLNFLFLIILFIPHAKAQQTEDTLPEKNPQIYKDPYTAYESGAYNKSLESFIDMQIDNPKNPHLMMNIGASYYKMKNYDEAIKAFEQALLHGDQKIRQEANYNLGNVAYKQGKLDIAIQYYQSALKDNPDDQDSKFNLEFVRKP